MQKHGPGTATVVVASAARPIQAERKSRDAEIPRSEKVPEQSGATNAAVAPTVGIPAQKTGGDDRNTGDGSSEKPRRAPAPVTMNGRVWITRVMQKTVDALSATPSVLLPAGASRTNGTAMLTLHDVPVIRSIAQTGEYACDNDARRPPSPTETYRNEDTGYDIMRPGTAKALAAWGD